MKTSLPCSTISYNSAEYLIKKLNRMIDEGTLSFYSFIYHFAEEDDKKDHIHLYIVPNGLQDTDKIREDLLELTNKEEKGLGTCPFRSSKFQEWFLYCSHNKKYLDSKMEVRKYNYQDGDFYSSDETYFRDLIHHIDWSKFMGSERFLNALRSGLDFRQCCIQGIVPISLVSQYRTFYDIYCSVTGVAKGETLSVPDAPVQKI